MVDEYLTDVVKVDAPEGVSNKAYADAEIIEAESTVVEVRRAIAAAAALVPTHGPYDENNTVARATLIGRGWTVTHIRRLLGEPDDYGLPLRANNPSHRYGVDRVVWAEQNDAKLIRRLRQFAAKKTAILNAKVTEAGEIIFRSINKTWHLEGMDLTVGEEVTVTRKDGSTTTAIVGRIIDDREGRRIATIATNRWTHAKKKRVTSKPTLKPIEEFALSTVTLGQVGPGDTIHRPFTGQV